MASKKVDYLNVNGVKLTLCINNKSSSPNAKNFTISFQNTESKSSWSKSSLLIAVVFNIIALIYIPISITVIFIVTSVFCFLLLFWITHSVQSESIFIIPLVGIQSTVKYVLGRDDKFIPWDTIDDVIINEVIQMNRVLYYLTVLVKESENIKLIPLFKNTKPRLFMLETIYTEIQSLLDIEQKNCTTIASGDVG